MGILNRSNSNSNVDLEITEEKISNLERAVEIFMNNQNKNIMSIFNDPKFQVQQNIEYNIDANNKFQRNENDITALHDYVIQWSIQGSNSANSTRCNLTLFNIGSLLGANGFLYSISLFYYYFMKIPIDNATEDVIKKDIENCLKNIDNGDINQLNLKWKVHLNNDQLNNLRLAKDFLINHFQEKITDDIFQKLNNNIIKKIWESCKTKFCNFCTIIFFFLTEKLSENDYIKTKNRINKNYLIQKLLTKLDIETFENNNIFIIATDNNVDSWINYGATFQGYYLEGLGEMHRARKLIINKTDGFMIGNNGNNPNKLLYDFYYNKISDIKLFFTRNNEKIDKINKGLNIKINIEKIAQELDYINQKYYNEEKIEEQRISNAPTRESISVELDDERKCEMERLTRKLLNNNYYRETETLIAKQAQTSEQNNNFAYNRNEQEDEKEPELIEA